MCPLGRRLEYPSVFLEHSVSWSCCCAEGDGERPPPLLCFLGGRYGVGSCAWCVSSCSPSFPAEFTESSYPTNEQSGLDLFLTSYPLSSSFHLKTGIQHTIRGWQTRYVYSVKILSRKQGHIKQTKNTPILAPSL